MLIELNDLVKIFNGEETIHRLTDCPGSPDQVEQVLHGFGTGVGSI